MDAGRRDSGDRAGMRVLFIAPLPPPITGHSLVSKALLDDLTNHHTVDVVDLKKESFTDGVDSAKRVREILVVLKRVWRKRKVASVIYLTISESRMGNLKDVVMYLLCRNRLSRMFIHLHGGTIKRELWDASPLTYWINRKLIGRMAGAIISGESHRTIFDGLLPTDKIHIVPNFADERMFATDDEIVTKFAKVEPLRLLYMSNFIEKKGYKDLVNGFLALPDALRGRVTIDFAGRFDSAGDEKAFLDWIAPMTAIAYHGVVVDAKKEMLFKNAHVFCLPTKFLEGQPVSILEAYAAGCVVLTTGQPGIRDVFADSSNGVEVVPGDATSIARAIRRLFAKRDELLSIAQHNSQKARREYRSITYTSAVRRIMEAGQELPAKHGSS
jgi:glycosyltransferase involved in cell wall biosynthesis